VIAFIISIVARRPCKSCSCRRNKIVAIINYRLLVTVNVACRSRGQVRLPTWPSRVILSFSLSLEALREKSMQKYAELWKRTRFWRALIRWRAMISVFGSFERRRSSNFWWSFCHGNFRTEGHAKEKHHDRAACVNESGIADATLRWRNMPYRYRPYRPLRCKFVIRGSITASTFTFDNYVLFFIYFLSPWSLSRDWRWCIRTSMRVVRLTKSKTFRLFVVSRDSSSRWRDRERMQNFAIATRWRFFRPLVEFAGRVHVSASRDERRVKPHDFFPKPH